MDEKIRKELELIREAFAKVKSDVEYLASISTSRFGEAERTGQRQVAFDRELINLRKKIDALEKGSTLMIEDRLSGLEKRFAELALEFSKLENGSFSSKNGGNNNNNVPLIVGNKSSKKLHYSTCAFAKRIRSDNRIIFQDIKDARGEGFKICSCMSNLL